MPNHRKRKQTDASAAPNGPASSKKPQQPEQPGAYDPVFDREIKVTTATPEMSSTTATTGGGSRMPPTKFLDMREQNDQERQRLLNRRYLLERMKGPDLQTRLEPQLEQEYRDVVEKTTRVDPDDDTSAYRVKLVDPF